MRLNVTYIKYSADRDESPAAEATRLPAQKRTERTRETTEVLASLGLRDKPNTIRDGVDFTVPSAASERYWSATARAAAQLPNVSVTTLADGQSPSVSRSSASPPRRSSVRTRPVIRGGQPTIAGPPRAHRVEHELARPAPLDRAGVTGLAVRVSVALAVARLCVRAAAAADPDVARLDRPRLLPVGS